MIAFRRTKIIATLGPATFSPEMIEKLIDAGVNVFRLNFSHGNHETYKHVIALIRSLTQAKKIQASILQDIQGPKIRIGDVENGAVHLQAGQTFKIQSIECVANSECASVSYPHLTEDVPQNSRILIDDGKIELLVQGKKNNTLICQVLNDGILLPNKGVNFPDVSLRIKAITEKDKKDILFGIENGVDFLAVSFVQRASDLMEAKDFLSTNGAETPVIAKIERQEAINNIEAIASLSDGIMIARGDLGVEIPAENVPMTQKQIIALCNKIGKPVITATQMLDSMIKNPRPTRAEASDVANAILDGTDSVMLSNETAIGKYPIKAVQTIHNIAVNVEKELPQRMERRHNRADINSISQSIGLATCQIAHSLGASAIITATHSGATARQVSRHRPPVMIVAATPNKKTYLELNLLWGVYPLLIGDVIDTDHLMRLILDEAVHHQLIENGDTVIITAGIPVGIAGTTNMIKVETVTKILARGIGLGEEIVSGSVIIAKSAEEACARVQEGNILVTTMTNKDFMPAFKKASAIITIEGGLTSHAAIVGLSLKKSVIIGVTNAEEALEENALITIDPERGLIFAGIPNIT